jgi:hypothetical protein
MSVGVDTEIVVRAKGPIDACEIALEAWKRRPRKLQVVHDRALVNMSTGLIEISDSARPSTILCCHCGKQSLKEDWGAGMVTCPVCGKTASSAAERVAFIGSNHWPNP